MLANGFMSAQAAARCYDRRQAIVAYSVHMGQFPVPQNSFRLKQVALLLHAFLTLWASENAPKRAAPAYMHLTNSKVVTPTDRWSVRNTIRIHELQLEHSEMMGLMLRMKHEDGNPVSLESRKFKELECRFRKVCAGEIVCCLPSHFEAGLKARVNVTK